MLNPTRPSIVFVALLVSTLLGPAALSENCPPVPPPVGPNTTHVYVEDANYEFTASSASGAVGDVVAINVALRSGISSLNGLAGTMVAEHDPEVLELVGAPIYASEFLSRLGMGVLFVPVDESAETPANPRGHGWFMVFGISDYSTRFPSDLPLPVMTLYYRVKGEPGMVGNIRFSDDVIENAQVRCIYNQFFHGVLENGQVTYFDYLSSTHADATVAILEGLPTQTERPPAPPKATIYPELPSAEEIDFKVRVTGATVRPGSQGIPIEVYASAQVEYISLQVPIDFDETILHLARADVHMAAGVGLINNKNEVAGNSPEEGSVILTNARGVDDQRLAAPGEEIHIATLFFDVLDGVEEGSMTILDVRAVNDTRDFTYDPWIGVRFKSTIGSDIVTGEVEPIVISDGFLNVRPEIALFIRGDSNGDTTVDVSDAVTTLGYLFLGDDSPRCFDAADANDDGAMDISDPIVTLGVLFLGNGVIPVPGMMECGVDPTDDELTCEIFERCP